MSTFRKKQQGAVAIMVGLTLVILIGMLALVVDLGHLYLAKAGLQNGADAAALAGAKELNGTVDGVLAARDKAIEVARQNNYSFSSPVGTDALDAGLALFVGSCPDDGCMVPIADITSDALAADKTFLLVDTQQRNLSTFFAPVIGINQTDTYGLAVAGRYVVDITPIGICELPPDASNPNTTERGYERGVTYRVSDANPLGPGTMFWIDPQATGPGDCDGSVPTSLPFICAGKVSFTPIRNGFVYTNTGISGPQLEALDSRFDVFNGVNKCDPAISPPDTNIKEYLCYDAVNHPSHCKYDDSGAGSASRWMNTDPVQQSIKFRDIGGINQPEPWTTRAFTDYGVLWSAFRPTVAAGDDTDTTVSTRWTNMYKAGANEATIYPQVSPYAKTAGDFFRSPSHDGQPNRRVMNMAIIDCTTVGGICRPAKVVDIGRFFLQRKANVSGDKDIYVEFGGLLDEPYADAKIRLYR